MTSTFGQEGRVRRSGAPILILVLAPLAALAVGCGSPHPSASSKGGAGQSGPTASAPRTSGTSGTAPPTTPVVPDTGAGAWSKAVPLAKGADLSVVSCPVAGTCLAASTGGQSYRLAAGRPETIGAVGNAPSPQGVSYLTCTTPTFCAAVPNLNQAVVFNGTAWSTPMTIPAAQGFESIGCAGTAWCIAIDGEGNSFVYDGTGWSGNVGAWGAANQISCVSPTFCAAVEGGTTVWNGHSWTQPGNADPEGQLNSVSCASTTFWVAVDSAGNALTWNGSAFTAPVQIATEPPLAGSDASGLTGVSCPTPTFCRAVDSIGRAFGFNGTAWSKGSLIDAGHALTAVSCPSVTFCAAVDRTGNAYVSAPKQS